MTHAKSSAGRWTGWLLSGLALLLGACSSGPTREFEPPVFPPAPAEPRFIFERSIRSSAQLRQLSAADRFRMMATGETTIGRGMGKPFDIDVCRGRIYITDTVAGNIKVFDVPGARFFEFGDKRPGAVGKPLGITTDGQCRVYVADARAGQILVYDQNGEFLQSLGNAELFSRLSHVAAAQDGSKVFAVDTGGVDSESHRIRVFDTQTGEHVYDIGTRGREEGEFNLPRDITVGPDNLLYVVDGGNFRIQIFRQDGTFVDTFGRVGRQTGQFSRPKGVDTDPAGNIYVSDAAFGNFQIFNRDGQLLLYVGGRSNTDEPGKFMLPAGLAVDEDGRVYMVDQFFRKVDVFRPAALPKDAGYLGAWHKMDN